VLKSPGKEKRGRELKGGLKRQGLIEKGRWVITNTEEGDTIKARKQLNGGVRGKGAESISVRLLKRGKPQLSECED